MPGDPAHVHGHRLGQARDAGVGQRDHDASGVAIGVGPTNEALIDQPGDTSGHARPRDEGAVCQLRHAQLATRERQLSEDIEIGQGKAGLLLEFHLELAHERGVGTQQRLPGPDRAPARQLVSYEPEDMLGKIGFNWYLHVQPNRRTVFASATIAAEPWKEALIMATKIDTLERGVVLVEDAHTRPMMGLEILEPLPSRHIPYTHVDPFILVHEGVVPADFGASVDTTHPHRGFDNLWYAISGSSSTGHSTGPGGAMERARLETGSLLKLRTGRGVLHAEALGEDEIKAGTASEMRSVLFWVNLERKDKDVAPTAQLLQPHDIPVRRVGDATVRTLVGEGSPVELGTPGLILDIELPDGGAFSTPVSADFNVFVYLLEGQADFGADRRRASRSQIAVLGPGSALTVANAQPGTRFMLMAGKPYGETPIYNGPYVD